MSLFKMLSDEIEFARWLDVLMKLSADESLFRGDIGQLLKEKRMKPTNGH
jgi:hypothetical protein